MDKLKKKIQEDLYGKTVKLNKDARLKAMKQFYAESLELDQMLSSFNGKSASPINFDKLDKFPLDEDVKLNDKVQVRKIESSLNKLVFQTRMCRHGEFGWHYHDDCQEFTQVIYGCLFDSLSGRTFNEGESVTYKKSEKHIPIALKDSFLIVTFTK